MERSSIALSWKTAKVVDPEDSDLSHLPIRLLLILYYKMDPISWTGVRYVDDISVALLSFSITNVRWLTIRAALLFIVGLFTLDWSQSLYATFDAEEKRRKLS